MNSGPEIPSPSGGAGPSSLPAKPHVVMGPCCGGAGIERSSVRSRKAERGKVVDRRPVVLRENGTSELFGVAITVPLPATRGSGEFDGLLATLMSPHDRSGVFVGSDPALSPCRECVRRVMVHGVATVTTPRTSAGRRSALLAS